MKKLIIHNPAIAALIWALFIFALCATPGRYIPSLSWLEILSFDKFVHATVFFVLCLLLFMTMLKHRQQGIWLLICFTAAVAYGVFLEWMQAHWFSERSADRLDIVANTFGSVMALTVIKKLKGIYVKAQ